MNEEGSGRHSTTLTGDKSVTLAGNTFDHCVGTHSQTNTLSLSAIMVIYGLIIVRCGPSLLVLLKLGRYGKCEGVIC